MNNFKKLILLLGLAVSLTACSGGDTTTTEDKPKTEDTQETKEEPKEEAKEAPEEPADENKEEPKEESKEEPKEEPKEDGPTVTVDQLPYNFTLDEELNSVGSAYAHFTYENKSEYPMLSFELEANLKDENEKTYYSNFDTVMPGEKSPNFESFAPKSLNKDDIEFLRINYRYKKDGKEYSVEYDIKLDEYDVLELLN